MDEIKTVPLDSKGRPMQLNLLCSRCGVYTQAWSNTRRYELKLCVDCFISTAGERMKKK